MVAETMRIEKKWTIRKYVNAEAYECDDPFDVVTFHGNTLLNEGITELLNLLVGAAATPFSQANAYLGVGDDATAEAATQTGLQAAVNKAWVQCEAGYPQVSAQTVTWRGVFGSAVANFDWNEFTVNNSGAGNDSGENLNRKVSAQGTKAAGQTWTLDLAITIS